MHCGSSPRFPVVAMLEASVVAAMQLGNKFSVLTGGAQWLPMLEEQIRVLGLLHRVASIRAIPLTGPEIVANQNRAMSLLAELSEACVRENGAECVILGGGAVAGIAPKSRIESAYLCLTASGYRSLPPMLARITTIPTGRKRPPSAESDGLSPELHDLLKNP